jgi:STE24 endopeptidase
MTFRRRWVILPGAAMLFASLTVLAPFRSTGQTAPLPSASRAAGEQTRPAAQQSAYKLPPEKLAKAIALGRIRDTMDIVGSLWGLAVL